MLNTLQLFFTKLKFVKTLKPIPSEYTCQYCKETKPLTDVYFKKVKNFKHGFCTVCNECA